MFLKGNGVQEANV